MEKHLILGSEDPTTDHQQLTTDEIGCSNLIGPAFLYTIKKLFW